MKQLYVTKEQYDLRFGLPSGGPWIETLVSLVSLLCLRLVGFGLPSGGPWIETIWFGVEWRTARRFGLPSGGPWIETRPFTAISTIL